ncbi:MAG: hypothetical protein HGB18_00280 [Candidatus Moranbacteria bacterium]|nr:hypothetical protein [Candidatus Moranbacteria bacterium]
MTLSLTRRFRRWFRVFDAVVILAMTFQPVAPAVIFSQEAPAAEEKSVVETPKDTEEVKPEEEAKQEVKAPEAPVTEESEVAAAVEPTVSVPEVAVKTETLETVTDPTDGQSAVSVEDGADMPTEPTVEAAGAAFDERAPEWKKNDDGSRTIRVVVGEEYAYPDSDLSIRFTKIDADKNAGNPREITVKSLKLSGRLADSLRSVSDDAYEITSSMEDGTFEYALSMPIGKGIDEGSLSAAYADDEHALEDERIKEVDDEDLTFDDDRGIATVSGMDHFTVWFLRHDPDPVKVNICHATGSETNPFTKNEVSINSVSKCRDAAGHDDHGGDIIPPYSYGSCSFRGQNWDTDGRAIWNNGCKRPLGSATLFVRKEVVNDDGGTLVARDFGLRVLDARGNDVTGSPVAGSESGIAFALPAGSYWIGERSVTGYVLKGFEGDCGVDGSVTLVAGESRSCTVVNDDIAPRLTVVKHVINDNDGTLSAGNFTMTVSGTGVSEPFFAGSETGTTVTLRPGSYEVGEIGDAGYSMTATESCSGTIALGEHRTCTLTNDDKAPVNIVAWKVVCDNESDLPNRDGGADISATTATDYVASHPSCRLVSGWGFEWGNEWVSNPGDDFVGPAGNGWLTFGPTGEDGSASVAIEDFSERGIWLREILQEGYLPFTYTLNGNTNANDVSAEFFCDTDVENYDNQEWIPNPVRGATYHCVAWNVGLGSIHGRKWEDLDGNGTMDEVENLLGGWTVFLDKDGDGDLDKGEESTETASEGDHFGWYRFGNLLPGTYSVCEVPREGWVQSYPGTVSEPACHSVTVPDSGNRESAGNSVDGSAYDFGNGRLGTLSIEKFNDATSPKKPGETVKYTLRISASEGRVLGVSVTDLPPSVAAYVDGSWSAESSEGSSHIGALALDHEYHSPGVWALGDMLPGEVITLSYDALVADGTDAGQYPDLAYAQGVGRSGNLYAMAGIGGNIDDSRYVGTAIAVADTDTADPAKVTTDHHEKEQKVVKGRVLGATLPETGSPSFILVLALLLVGIGGATLAIGGSVRSGKLRAYLRRTVRRWAIVPVVVLTGASWAWGTVDAGSIPDLYIRAESPESAANGSFLMDYVTLDTDKQGGIDVSCQVKKPGASGFATFQTAVIDNEQGGNSGQCEVGPSELADDGTYVFRVKAESGSEEALSAEYSVAYDSTLPGRPKSIDKSYVSSCINRVKLRTADDGQTTRVEVYRSTSEDFMADASTLVHTAVVGPNATYEYDDARPSAICGNRTYYAVRAFDDAGNASPVREEDMTETNKTTAYEDVTTEGSVTLKPGAGTTVSEGTGSGETTVTGEVAGEQSGSGEGTVEGAETTAGGFPRWGWILVALAAYAGYRWYALRKERKARMPKI